MILALLWFERNKFWKIALIQCYTGCVNLTYSYKQSFYTFSIFNFKIFRTLFNCNVRFNLVTLVIKMGTLEFVCWSIFVLFKNVITWMLVNKSFRGIRIWSQIFKIQIDGFNVTKINKPTFEIANSKFESLMTNQVSWMHIFVQNENNNLYWTFWKFRLLNFKKCW